MTVHEWMILAQEELEVAGIGTARLDCLVLLENVLSTDRAKLLAEPGVEISKQNLGKLAGLLRRRADHEPVAYLIGKTEFYGREFIISPAVLEPRPESETMIDLLKKLDDISTLKNLADVGTGSGALGITAKLELPKLSVELLDIDESALKIARENVDKYTIDVSVNSGDLLRGATQEYDILLCNLPYVPDDYQINQAASQEPKIAIFGGPDGLDIYRQLFKQIEELAKRPLYILTESLPFQHAELKQMAAESGYKEQLVADFIQLFKLM